jgi:hypothetical protein
MDKLDQLIQRPDGDLEFKNKYVSRLQARQVCPLRTLVIRNPATVKETLDEMAEHNSAFIPKNANSYVASEFDGGTQHVRRDDNGNEKMYSVYAIQFYSAVLE